MAAGPYILGKLFEMGVEMTEGKEQAARTGKQYEGLMGQLPHQIQSFQQDVPSMLAQLEGASPEQALQIFNQLQQIQGTFGGSGMENFLRQGETGSQYGDFAKGISAKFPQSQEVNQALQPFLGALSLGRIRAQDIAQAGGMTDPRFFTPEQAAMSLGQELYSSSEAGSPGAWSTRPTNEWIAQNYRDPWAGRTQQDIEAGQHAGTVPWSYNLGDVSWSPEAQQAFAGIQPGGLEQGLSQLFGGQFAPSVQPWLQLPQQIQEARAADPVTQQLQQFTQGIGGLTQQADPLLQAFQQQLQGAPVPQEMAMAGAPAGGGGAPPAGNTGGVDLERLLRELGYLT
jgi:hypothetical protein